MTRTSTRRSGQATPSSVRLDELAMAAGLAGDSVTRREVADLGNVRSGLVRRLVTYLRQDADGYEWYRRMGTARRPPNRSAWATAPVDALSANLLAWSVKQVRSHFDCLQRDGLIAAERDQGNGPWRYALPVELSDASFPFHYFPPLARLEPCCAETNGEEASGHDTCPVCPSPARDGGQTKLVAIVRLGSKMLSIAHPSKRFRSRCAHHAHRQPQTGENVLSNSNFRRRPGDIQSLGPPERHSGHWNPTVRRSKPKAQPGSDQSHLCHTQRRQPNGCRQANVDLVSDLRGPP